MTVRFLSLLISLMLVLNACSKKRTELVIAFDRIDNLDIGSPVKIHGYDIGKVSGLKLVDTGVLVKIRIKEQVPAGSVFSIISSVIGSAWVDIEPSNATVFLTKRDTVNGKYNEKGLLDDFVSDSVNRKKINNVVDTIITVLRQFRKLKDSTGN